MGPLASATSPRSPVALSEAEAALAAANADASAMRALAWACEVDALLACLVARLAAGFKRLTSSAGGGGSSSGVVTLSPLECAKRATKVDDLVT